MSLMLRPNEYLKFEAHFSYKVFVIPTLLMSIGILIFLAVWSGVAGDATVAFMGKAYSVATLMIVLGISMFFPYIYRRADNKLKIYAVTNQRVYVRRGIINIKEKDIPLAKINDVQISRTLVQRIFNAGDISVQVGNDDSSMIIDDISRPREFRDMVISAIYEAAAEQEAKAREQQRLQQEQQRQKYQEQMRQRQYYEQQQGGYYNQNDYSQGYNNQGYNQGNYQPQDYGNQGYQQQPQGNYSQGYGYNSEPENETEEYHEEDYYKNF